MLRAGPKITAYAVFEILRLAYINNRALAISHEITTRAVGKSFKTLAD
jgi:hypothetical protein